jgi:acetolactate synthase-1/3 small subunit
MTSDGADRVRVLSVVVEDHPGVLFRVSGLIRRRGFNIEGLSVGPIDVDGRSRMTLTVHAGHAEVDQVQKQLDKMIEVIEVTDITDDPILTRELLIARVEGEGAARRAVESEVQRFGARVLDTGPESVIVELAADAAKVEEFLALMRRHGIKEMARSGPVAMRRIQR